jgi:LmbE family N-acetylglucosaminyl deacetylase
MGKFLNADKVLCLSPHPDDIEYGALGIMYKFQDTKFDIITISIGGKFDTTSSRNRFEECNSIWSEFPNVSGTFLLDDHTINFGYDHLVHMIESNHDISAYDIILLPPEEDTHHDHKKINVVGMALTRKEKCSIVDYKTPSTLDTWVPNYFVDINNHLEDKITQLKKFKTQSKHLYFTDDVIKSFHTNYQCARRGYGFVEMFKIHRLYE